MRKDQIVAGLILLFFLTASASPAAAQSEKLGLLRIKAEYPVQVPRSYMFQVKLTVEYAFREYYEIHAAVYEGPMGAFGHLLWEGETEGLIEVGDKTYDVSLESPSEDRQWVLTCYVFYHGPSGPIYFTDQERGPGFAEMDIKIADNAKLTLRTPHPNMSVSVNGAQLTTGQNGILTRELKVLARHSVEAPENVSIGDGWRAVFLSWNGTSHENPKSLLVNADVLLTVDYRDEFRLDVVSDVGQVRGSGWYQGGTVANFSAPAFVPVEGLGGLLGVQSRFAGWSGDINSNANHESVVMDRPFRVVANWIVDYEAVYYLVIVLAGLVLGVLAAFVGRKMTKKRSEAEAVPTARTYCMFCGVEIDPDAKFCSKCGKSQVSSG